MSKPDSFSMNPNPMSYYSQTIYNDFVENNQARRKVKRMGIKLFKDNYPGVRPIVNKTDVLDAMCYVVDTQHFRQTHNLHNLFVDAANKLYHNIVENVYAEEELGDEWANVQHRVHEVSQAQSMRGCKNMMKDKCYYVTGNIV